MNNKLKIIVLILGSLTLMGCPPGHYHRYKYIGNKSTETDGQFTQLEFNEFTDIGIASGFYYQFVGNKERGLATRIRIKKNNQFDLNKVKVSVNSSKFGELIKRELPNIPYFDSLRTLVFDKQIDIRKESKILKLIENDTITIEFEDGMKYQFVK